ncbi:hypothetical protein BDW02DRAFT_568273 [Decorospora gaudefroyi]|uniref:Uncharacterized protein n=1 Tax=Decorospora gaudefroyi TaxID=184978 RepID=A0A6A5KI76_9PLEO|nr:hypothetical protein BDW02DRAFT_568273 [Decorospora gaudefroyi]
MSSPRPSPKAFQQEMSSASADNVAAQQPSALPSSGKGPSFKRLPAPTLNKQGRPTKSRHFDINDDIDSGSASAFAHSRVSRGSNSRSSNPKMPSSTTVQTQPAPKYHHDPPPSYEQSPLPPSSYTNSSPRTPPTTEPSPPPFKIVTRIQNLPQSTAGLAYATVSISVQFKSLDRELLGREDMEERAGLIEREVRVRALEVLNAAVKKEVQGGNWE